MVIQVPNYVLEAPSAFQYYGALGARLSAVSSFIAQLGSWVEYLLNLRDGVAKLLCQEARMLGLILGWVRRCRMEVMS